MSYILEALKKSEQERGHGSAPGIQTVHSSSLNYQATKRSPWPWIFITVVVLNLAVLVYFVFYKQPATPLQEAAIAVPGEVQNQVAIPETPAPVVLPAPAPAPVVQVETPAAPQQNSQQSRPGSSVQNSSAPIAMQAVDIMQIPDNIRQQIPDMNFSAHVYSSNPIQRSVVINGRFMEEGESMNEDFVLREITTTGVIMEFRGYLFHTSVITGWNVR